MSSGAGCVPALPAACLDEKGRSSVGRLRAEGGARKTHLLHEIVQQLLEICLAAPDIVASVGMCRQSKAAAVPAEDLTKEGKEGAERVLSSSPSVRCVALLLFRLGSSLVPTLGKRVVAGVVGRMRAAECVIEETVQVANVRLSAYRAAYSDKDSSGLTLQDSGSEPGLGRAAAAAVDLRVRLRLQTATSSPAVALPPLLPCRCRARWLLLLLADPALAGRARTPA
jgi:hypothetical protein